MITQALRYIAPNHGALTASLSFLSTRSLKSTRTINCQARTEPNTSHSHTPPTQKKAQASPDNPSLSLLWSYWWVGGVWLGLVLGSRIQEIQQTAIQTLGVPVAHSWKFEARIGYRSPSQACCLRPKAWALTVDPHTHDIPYTN